MASHQVAIAKAAFSAGLLRPDPTATSRDEITNFHGLLDKVIAQCSPTNIQNSARITALGKYITALSTSFEVTPSSSGSRPNRPKPSAKRRRIHILYLLNDLYHHVKYNGGTSSSVSSVTGGTQPYLEQLFSAAASFQSCPKHHRKLHDLLKIWEEEGYYSKAFVAQLHEVINNAKPTQQPLEAGQSSSSKDGKSAGLREADTGINAPFLMPATHGDPATPYYDLPAGNLLPHIIPNSSQPINPQLVKPLQLAAGPAESGLVIAVKDFLEDVDRLFEPRTVNDERLVMDVDELGQLLIKDEVTGELVAGETYYGWSKSFCEKMKERRKSRSRPDRGHRGRSDSRGRSLSPRKRTKYGRYDSSSGSRGERRRSYSPSRSRSRHRQLRQARHNRSHSRTPRWTPSPSHSPGRHRSRHGKFRSRSRSPSYSPRDSPGITQPPVPSGNPLTLTYPGAQPLPHPHPNGPLVPDPALIAQFISQSSQLLPGVPVPPSSQHGQWTSGLPPPPLPPALASSTSYAMSSASQFGLHPPYLGFPLPPPPPPPATGTREYSGHVERPYPPPPTAGQWRPS
ncbi:MAG: hypothetical protein M1816_000593 [Peltula sp. TS41687]|nr:MAG: hypothetical protein M1816_000593 [Peltula sp. TS41687]